MTATHPQASERAHDGQAWPKRAAQRGVSVGCEGQAIEVVVVHNELSGRNRREHSVVCAPIKIDTILAQASLQERLPSQ